MDKFNFKNVMDVSKGVEVLWSINQLDVQQSDYLILIVFIQKIMNVRKRIL